MGTLSLKLSHLIYRDPYLALKLAGIKPKHDEK